MWGLLFHFSKMRRKKKSRGTGIRRPMSGMATLPKVTRICYWSKIKLEDPR